MFYALFPFDAEEARYTAELAECPSPAYPSFLDMANIADWIIEKMGLSGSYDWRLVDDWFVAMPVR